MFAQKTVGGETSYENSLFTILKTLPFALFYCDRSLMVRYINKAYAGYLGLEPEDIIGRKITEFIPKSRARQVMESGREELYQTSSLLSGKMNQRILVNRLPVRDRSGAVTGYISQLLSVGDAGWSDLWSKLEYAEKILSSVPSIPGMFPSVGEAEHGIVGSSPELLLCIERAQAYAKTSEPVLLLGPTGAGKELFARLILRASARKDRPFISVNCASISHEFIRSELFGYAPGAFTGAERHGKAGLIEMADTGTLFLDEIGDLPLEAQGVLLRVLETHQVQRLNALDSREVDFRIVAATNKNLTAMCREGLFREDLFYRLNTLTLCIPPLRERTGDIPLLVKHFLGRMNGPELNIDTDSMNMLEQYPWPGNVRELRNALTFAAVNASYKLIRPVHLPLRVQNWSPESEAAAPAVRESDIPSDKEQLERSLARSGGNISKAARLLGISRTTFYARLKKYGLQ